MLNNVKSPGTDNTIAGKLHSLRSCIRSIHMTMQCAQG